MKRAFFLLFSLGLFLLAAGFSGALELEITGGLNFLTFDSEGSILNAPSEELKPVPFIISTASLKGNLTNSFAIGINFERDSLFENIVDLRFSARKDYFALELGSFVGFNSNFDIPDAGILGSIEVTWPGVLFLSFSGSSTLGAQFNFSSNTVRETIEARLGFWLPFGMTNVSVLSKNYTRYTENNDNQQSLSDSLLRYQLSVEFFSKNSPFLLRIDGGYFTLKRTYGNTNTTDELNAFFAGLEMNLSISKVRLIAGAEVPFIITSFSPMTVSSDILFKAYAGIAYRFF